MFGTDKSLSEEVRCCTQKTIITCGGIGSVAEGEKLLNSGSSDMIAYGRALLANSEFIKMLGTDNFRDFEEYNSRIHDAKVY
jgi:2,4-dienoyl-CoA reductase-like NADH-dependent reductase (Old Yellow Enzyme family)